MSKMVGFAFALPDKYSISQLGKYNNMSAGGQAGDKVRFLSENLGARLPTLPENIIMIHNSPFKPATYSPLARQARLGNHLSLANSIHHIRRFFEPEQTVFLSKTLFCR
jgi:hypothetical protein